MNKLLANKILGVSIDKITVIGYISDVAKFQHQIVSNLNICKNYNSKYSKYRLMGFDSSIQLANPFLGAIDIKSTENIIRYEYNPNTIKDEGLEEYNKIILDNIKNREISRLDIAIDIYLPQLFSDYDINYSNPVSKRIYTDKADRIETKYFGDITSDTFYRVYDKAKESKKNKKSKEYAQGVWRIEVQINTKSKVEEFATGKYLPFEELTILPKSDVDRAILEALDYTTFQKLAFEQVYKDISLYDKLSQSEKRKYRAIKKDYEAQLNNKLDIKPVDLYKLCKKGILEVRKELQIFTNTNRCCERTF